jgi:hypothetical protein
MRRPCSREVELTTDPRRFEVDERFDETTREMKRWPLRDNGKFNGHFSKARPAVSGQTGGDKFER